MTDPANIARYLLGEAETIPYPDYEAKDGHKADAIAILTELGQAEAERDALRERAEKAEAKAARFAALLVSAMKASVRVRDSIDQFVADLARALVAAQHELKRASDALVAAGEDLDAAGGWGITNGQKALLRDAFCQANQAWKRADESYTDAFDDLCAAIDAEQAGE